MVFSPKPALPRWPMAATPAAKAGAKVAAVIASAPCLRRVSPIAMKKLAISGPDAPPMLESSFLPMRMNTSSGGNGRRVSSIAATTAQPRVILIRWSPSPISRSSDSISA